MTPFFQSNETPNHALQRTAPRVTARAFCERSGIYIWASFVRSTVGHAPRHAPPSLSLGSLGVATRLVLTNDQLEKLFSLGATPSTKAIPHNINGARVICYSPIDHRHTYTSSTPQIVAGQVLGSMSGLAICQYHAEDCFYLFGCNPDWGIVTDTQHQTLDEALHQAEFEYVGVSSTWTYLNAHSK